MTTLRWILAAGCLATLGLALLQTPPEKKPESIAAFNMDHPTPLSRGNAKKRAEYERLRLRNPKTGEIPRAIRSREQAFALGQLQQVRKDRQRELNTQEWSFRGPVNIGGRTRALVVDALDHNRLLAGSVTGALYESLDGAETWQRLTPMNQLPGVTCLTQDTREGYEQTWYYGTGEYTGSGSRSINSRVPGYFGDGIFKSIDGGHSWQQLEATADTPSSFGSPFDVVFAVVVHSSSLALDRVLAACYGTIQLSEDGGETWQTVLGEFGPQNQAWTHVHCTPSGVLYAMLSSASADPGIWRSADGIQWEEITPEGWPAVWNRVLCAHAPSDEEQLYFLGETPNAGYQGSGGDHSLWFHDAGEGTWEDRSVNMPDFQQQVQLPFGYDYGSQGGYDMCIAVSPEDPEAVFIGGTSLFRSLDGFTTDLNSSWIGGYNYYYNLLPGPEGADVSYPEHHADVHSITFDPEWPAIIYSSHDGGVSRAEDAFFQPDANTPFPWELAEGYPTTQFYWVSVDPAHAGDPRIIGGMQDNGTWMASGADAEIPWVNIRGGDGMACAIGGYADPGYSAVYASTQYGGSFVQIVHDEDNNFVDGSWITPEGDFQRWITPYVLDPTDNSRMLLGGTSGLWVNEGLYDTDPGQDWEYLQSTDFPQGWVTAVCMAEEPAGRAWYGVYDYSDGQNNVVSRVLQVDNVFGNDPLPLDLTSPDFPAGGWIHCIETHPENPDEVVVVFTNYEVPSVFRSVDGGFNWTDIGGNLEEFPDGSGAGPSCYWLTIVPWEDETLYLLGTSTGLWSTTDLDGESVEWQLEGENTIGTVWVTAMDVRREDGYVAVGTHGHGTFSGQIDLTSVGDPEDDGGPEGFALSPAYPNPFNSRSRVRVDMPQAGHLRLELYNLIGARVALLEDRQLAAGSHELAFDAGGLASGSYLLRATLDGKASLAQKVQLIK